MAPCKLSCRAEAIKFALGEAVVLYRIYFTVQNSINIIEFRSQNPESRREEEITSVIYSLLKVAGLAVPYPLYSSPRPMICPCTAKGVLKCSAGRFFIRASKSWC